MKQIVDILLLFQKHDLPSGEDNIKDDKDYKPHGIVGRMAIKPPIEKHARRSKRFENDADVSYMNLLNVLCLIVVNCRLFVTGFVSTDSF